MISSKPRLVVPYGLKTLLEGVSRAILKTNPTNITQFAAVYFKELIVFREGNSSLDIKDLIKQFHQMKVEKWAEGVTLEKKECVKEPGRTPPVSCEPTRMEKSTDTEEDNVAGPLFSNKTTQFPSVHAELQPEETSEGVCGPSSKPATPKTTTPPSSPPPAPVSAEYAYVPADPAQFAAQMLGNVPCTYSEVLMVDVATSTLDSLSAECDEEVVVSAPLVYSGEMLAVQVMSQTSAQAVVGPNSEAEPPKASSAPLQGEQEPPAYDEAPDTQVTSAVHVSSVYNGVPVNEGVVYVEQIPGYVVIPFTDQVACLKEIEQSPPVSPKPVETKTSSGMAKISVESQQIVQVENSQHQSSVHMEAEATVLLSDTALEGQPEVPAEPLDAEGFVKIASENSLHFEVEIVTIDPDSPGQEESGENAAPYSSGDPFPPAPGGFTEPEIQPDGEDAPEQV
ncbi:calcium-binding tyrosine phosphorylation-regulated protein isoform X1 [Chionomys nivalis]|uniref:calcium-binding tyrosine phosphorylation-regulated protein isoform X1 n=1 Tax=Chionomys nivalis TaxID=269649 RepID=UPI00259AAF20|nr:calcium-binding tyrosine phosphorylation-regulated protein isoform X1 [Chionomys nivalis]XP_057645351.1 calcium-binding tyrosine phosphorylation-regulated protein isoform X1 [Chionomys nivalis]XP_057645352.1 calcium-binding tyrosine phosphorylation-regulated protein isoform X1 [Chionomys nivalis]XP_057645354.1 calcium-binding tyrosine phosphorylation-regulated protein isoform X1 [Chionomys nivalis]